MLAMEKEILTAAVSQDIWKVLSIFLLFYILRAQEKIDQKKEERENNYQNIISQLTDKLGIVDEVKKM